MVSLVFLSGRHLVSSVGRFHGNREAYSETKTEANDKVGLSMSRHSIKFSAISAIIYVSLNRGGQGEMKGVREY